VSRGGWQPHFHRKEEAKEESADASSIQGTVELKIHAGGLKRKILFKRGSRRTREKANERPGADCRSKLKKGKGPRHQGSRDREEAPFIEENEGLGGIKKID